MPQQDAPNIDAQKQKRILLRLANGVTTQEELSLLTKISKRKYGLSPTIENFIRWQCFNEMGRRLRTNVFSEIGKEYPVGYKRFATHAEYHNTKLFIELVSDMVRISLEHGDITDPKSYGIQDAGYKVTLETAVHILLRHNDTMNDFINQDSKQNGYNPSSFSFGVVADSMLTLFMSLPALDENDWIFHGNVNLVCHVNIYGRPLTIVRNGTAREIKTFYPRNDGAEVTYIDLEKHPERRVYRKKPQGIG